MAPGTREVATKVFASESVQSVVIHGQYTEEFIANQCLLAANELASVVAEQKIDVDCKEVAVGAFTALVGRIIIGGTPLNFRELAEIACKRAAAFNVYCDRATKPKVEAPQAEHPQVADQGSQGADAGKTEGTADIAVEALGLSDTIVELLQAAGLSTASAIVEADKTGKVEAINGIGKVARKKILEAVEAKLSAAQ